MQLVNRKSEIVNEVWLPDMDLNHDKQIQSLLCYRYTIGQAGALLKLKGFTHQSSRQTAVVHVLQKERGLQPASSWLRGQSVECFPNKVLVPGVKRRERRAPCPSAKRRSESNLN